MEGKIDYESVARKGFELYKTLQARSDWVQVKEADGATLSSVVLEGEPINCFRAVGVVPGRLFLLFFLHNSPSLAGKSPKEMAELMDNFELKEWKILDSEILDWAIIEKGDKYRVFYQENNLPWPLWHR